MDISFPCPLLQKIERLSLICCFKYMFLYTNKKQKQENIKKEIKVSKVDEDSNEKCPTRKRKGKEQWRT